MNQPKLIKSLDKGLRILEIIGESETPVTITKLSKMLGMNKSSVFRLLNTLKARGFVLNPPNSKAFVLGSAIWTLADKTQWINTLVQVAREYLVQLTSLTGETSHIAILEGNRTLIIDNEMSTQSIGVNVKIGETALIHCTSIGKSLVLDFSKKDLINLVGTEPLKPFTPNTLPDVESLFKQLSVFKDLGYVIDDEEYLMGVRCIGVPIRDASGLIVAALGVSAPLERLPPTKYEEMGKQVAYIGKLIGQKLGADFHAAAHIEDA